jgi:hypothetical protein
VTTAKLVPIVVFIIVCVFALKAGVFAHNFWGGGARSASALFGQVRATMLREPPSASPVSRPAGSLSRSDSWLT